MAIVIRPAEAKALGLPGRVSNEIVSGAHGSSKSVTLRLVEIPVSRPSEPQRARHCHDGHEECMYVLSGHGTTSSGTDQHPLQAGDTILVPAGEMHVTRNTGSVPLVMLCFFPVAEIDMQLEDQPKS
jgi:mannose-6-phosphate isomerase-like protein (cupin superfamily)